MRYKLHVLHMCPGTVSKWALVIRKKEIQQIWDTNALLPDHFLTKSEQFELVYQCKARLHGLNLHYSWRLWIPQWLGLPQQV